MKKNDKKSRILIWAFVLGGSFLLGIFSGRAYALGEFLVKIPINISQLSDSIAYILSAIFLVLCAVAYYLNKESRKGYKQLQESEDDEESDALYRKTYRYMEYGILLHNIAVVNFILIALLLFSSNRIVFESLTSLLLVFLNGILLILAEVDMHRTIKLIRGYTLTMTSLPRDALDFVNSYDEGERQANLEQSFLILFQLNQIVLPIMYAVLFFISLLLHSHQIVAYIAVVFIHFYINVMQYKMIKSYFK